jgi:hypothetical protein
VAAAVRPDHDAPDAAGGQRGERAERVHVLPGVGEVGTVATVDPAAVDEQRLVAIVERCPLDRLLLEVQLGEPGLDPVEQDKPVGVGAVHVAKDRAQPGSNGRSSIRSARPMRSAPRCGHNEETTTREGTNP